MPFLATIAVAIPMGLDLYLPVPEGNPLTADKIELGRLSFSPRLRPSLRNLDNSCKLP